MELSLPAVFSNNMVLQRRKHVLVWGKAKEGVLVKVNIAGQEGCGKCYDGRFEVLLNPMEAGGPYTMTVTDGESCLRYENVLVGEVWLAGGQSNMELELQNSDNGREIVDNAHDEELRYYYTPKISYICDELLEAEKNSGWEVCRPGTAACWSAVAYYWAEKMRRELNVPVGIIGCNWGGTYAHNWVSRERLLSHSKTQHFVLEYEDMVANQNFDDYLRELEEYREYYKEWVKRVDACYAQNPDIEWQDVLAIAGENRWPGPSGPRFEYRPYGLYESMLCRVAPYTLGGAIYYQGENDENNNAIYDVLLRNLIDEWRRLWRDDSLPFGIVQLPVHDPDTEKTGRGWGGVRRAQDKICRTVKNTSLTVITDCGNKKNIHPTDKKTVGERLAENVLKDIFGLHGYNGNGPQLDTYEYICRNGINGILLRFSGADEGFWRKEKDKEGAYGQGDKLVVVTSDDKCLTSGIEGACEGFEIAWNEAGVQVYYPAKVKLVEGALFIYNEKVGLPRYARYGNDNYYRPLLLDKKGRPLMPFWIG